MEEKRLQPLRSGLLKIGLTGGVACGKTTVGEMFSALGARIALADDIARDLMQPAHQVYDRVVAAFGAEILNEDRTINRPRLADAAFPTGRIAELNAIVHPAVIDAEEEWMRQVFREDPKAIAIVEAALMLESGSWKHFDKMITITCTFEQKVERFARRHDLTLDAARAEVERRMQAQATDEEKIRISQYVIDNSGPLEKTREQVARIWPSLKTLSMQSAFSR
jgi:dephospho-CoA kinase